MRELLSTFFETLRDFNVFSVVFRLILATIISGIVGSERSKMGRAAGLRVHILVCLGATIAAMTGLFISNNYAESGDISRIASQVVSGIGFLGAGTILVKNKYITGLTTAACVWATGAIGIAIGYGFYEAALIGGILVFLITGKLSEYDKKLHPDHNEYLLYIEFKNPKKINDTIQQIKKDGYYVGKIKLLPSRNNLEKYIATEIIIGISQTENADEFCQKINDLENVFFAIISERQGED